MVRVYVDSCIIIYLIEGSAPIREAVRHAFQSRRDTEAIPLTRRVFDLATAQLIA